MQQSNRTQAVLPELLLSMVHWKLHNHSEFPHCTIHLCNYYNTRDSINVDNLGICICLSSWCIIDILSQQQWISTINATIQPIYLLVSLHCTTYVYVRSICEIAYFVNWAVLLPSVWTGLRTAHKLSKLPAYFMNWATVRMRFSCSHVVNNGKSQWYHSHDISITTLMVP